VSTPVLLDTDLAMGAPGSDIDDGFALAMCLADPDLDLRLVTTVNGNTDVDTATVLTLELLHRLGRDQVPVHRGADRPLIRPRAKQGSVPAGVRRRAPAPGPAAMALVHQVLAAPGELTLIAVGPLTNVALAMRLEPRFAASLKALVIMGGVFLGRTNAAGMPGEFNVWSDPEAAQIVLTSGIQARWVGLDVTRRVRLTRGEAESMAASRRAFESFAGRYSVAWIDHLGGTGDPAASCALHDPLAVAAASRAELVTFRPAFLQVETGDLFRGAIVTDLGARSHHLNGDEDGVAMGYSPNAEVAVDVDAAGFRTHFRGLMGRL
jgi:inosine-uridine nucleoside N-ribohydrolase